MRDTCAGAMEPHISLALPDNDDARTAVAIRLPAAAGVMAATGTGPIRSGGVVGAWRARIKG